MEKDEFPRETRKGSPVDWYASCLAIDRAENLFLLVSRHRPGSTSWIIPKSKINEVKDAEMAAQSALRDEAGVEGTCPKLIGIFKETRPEGKALHWIYELDITAVSDTYPNPRQRSRRWCSYDEALAAIKAPFLLDAIKISSISPPNVQADCATVLEKKKKKALKKAKKAAKKDAKKKAKRNKKASEENNSKMSETLGTNSPVTNEGEYMSSASLGSSLQNSLSEMSLASSSQPQPQHQEAFDLFSHTGSSDQSTPGTTPGSTEKTKEKQSIKPLPNPKYVGNATSMTLSYPAATPLSATAETKEREPMSDILYRPDISSNTAPNSLKDIRMHEQMHAMNITDTDSGTHTSQEKSLPDLPSFAR